MCRKVCQEISGSPRASHAGRSWRRRRFFGLSGVWFLVAKTRCRERPRCASKASRTGTLIGISRRLLLVLGVPNFPRRQSREPGRLAVLLLLTVSSGTGLLYALQPGHHMMERKQISIGKILAPAVVCLLLCGIVAGEFPELLSLADNTANDFTVRSAHSVVPPPVRLSASKNIRIANKDSAPATDLLFSPLSPFEKAQLILEVFVLHSVLRR